MKTTIEISDHLLIHAKERARARKITLKSLIEESLAASLETPVAESKVEPVTFKGNGLNPEFDGVGWEQIREAIYP